MRQLTDSEINILTGRGCSATNWKDITVSDDFDPCRLRNVEFSGSVSIGPLNGTFSLAGGVTRRSEIRNAMLHNVSVGRDVYISGIANFIANYDIADGVYIENVDSIVATLDSTFGIGTEVSVLNETGGREVAIYERLSAHTAYLMAMYRNRSLMVTKIIGLIKSHSEQLRGRRGQIGAGAHIANSGEILNIMIGDMTRIDGAARLNNGYIASSAENPVFVGRDVIADNFILASGSTLSDGAVIKNCFVGQASHLSHLFSAHDSLFFANCLCENGEAAAIFGGPYTFSMHKSSLLIAGMFSFLNAGSGSNQSNHMYKLGPIHQGVIERGSKTTSDSYVLWPARIGAFSLVMGRHVTHPDTSALPFSYLIESHNDSFLVPGINLRSVGTIRDARKWPKRDRRKGSDRLDCINFNLLSPYTAGKMMEGIELLGNIEQTSGLTAQRYAYQTMIIDAHALRKGRKLYRLAINKFIGNSVISRLGSEPIESCEELTRRLLPTNRAGAGQWVDICGLIAPKNEVDIICDDIESGVIENLEQLEQRWHTLHDNYYDMEWTWVADNFERWFGKRVDELTPQDIRTIINMWIESVTALNSMLLDDARKEFSLTSQTGFGIDGPAADAAADFINVRGNYDCDPFVEMVKSHSVIKSALAEQALSLLPS